MEEDEPLTKRDKPYKPLRGRPTAASPAKTRARSKEQWKLVLEDDQDQEDDEEEDELMSSSPAEVEEKARRAEEEKAKKAKPRGQLLTARGRASLSCSQVSSNPSCSRIRKRQPMGKDPVQTPKPPPKKPKKTTLMRTVSINEADGELALAQGKKKTKRRVSFSEPTPLPSTRSNAPTMLPRSPEDSAMGDIADYDPASDKITLTRDQLEKPIKSGPAMNMVNLSCFQEKGNSAIPCVQRSVAPPSHKHIILRATRSQGNGKQGVKEFLEL
ncbi:hypothetical protein DFH09DRAFT_1078764 [Mycena vulgaris]|nr:hypothetical protein DFH09DRAFT_1078764 [Mycena vulgaris]